MLFNSPSVTFLGVKKNKVGIIGEEKDSNNITSSNVQVRGRGGQRGKVSPDSTRLFSSKSVYDLPSEGSSKIKQPRNSSRTRWKLRKSVSA